MAFLSVVLPLAISHTVLFLPLLVGKRLFAWEHGCGCGGLHRGVGRIPFSVLYKKRVFLSRLTFHCR